MTATSNDFIFKQHDPAAPTKLAHLYEVDRKLHDRWTVWKREMTKAVRSGDPERVIEEWERFSAHCERNGSWPEWWETFEEHANRAHSQLGEVEALDGEWEAL